jgi:hypothetical protein
MREGYRPKTAAIFRRRTLLKKSHDGCAGNRRSPAVGPSATGFDPIAARARLVTVRISDGIRSALLAGIRCDGPSPRD